MLLSADTQVSLEAINFQSGQLFRELTLSFTNIRKSADDNKELEKAFIRSNIPKVIAKQTGIQISLNYMDVPFANAMVQVPFLDKNHPLLNEYRRFPEASLEGLAAVRANKGLLKGEVDVEKSRVSGFFGQLVSEVYFTRGILQGDMFTDEELAAVLLHELGHLFTYYERLGQMVTTNYVLATVANEWSREPSAKRRYMVIDELNNVINAKIDDPEALVAEKKGEVVQTVVLSKVLERQKHELGSNTYDATSWEMMADQFANRHGAGRALVTGLAKIEKSVWNTNVISTPVYLLMEVVKALLFFASFWTGVGVMVALAIIFSDSNYSDYDSSKDRVERIRRDLVDQLKDTNLTRDRRQQVQDDLEAIDVVSDTMTKRRSLLQLIHSNVGGNRRRQYSQKVFQQELEELAFNDLFIQSNRFATLR